MTKEEFIAGTPFYVGKRRYKGESTHYYDPSVGCISKQSRSSVDERVVLDDYACNVKRVGRLGFEGFTHVLGKQVNVKYKFEHLSVFEG